jgi:hypothetical protein
VTVAASNPSRQRRWLSWIWPIGLLLVAWAFGVLRAASAYPGMPCTANADTVFRVASYTLFFLPVAAILLLLTRRLIPGVLRRGLRVWAAGLTALGVAVAVAFLALGGITVSTGERPIDCPALGSGIQSIHCWRSGSTVEVNGYGRRPLDLGGVQAMAQALAATKQDAALYEAFVLDTTDPAIADYSNARLFVLQRQGLTSFGDLCLSEHQAKLREVQAHRIGFYRYSNRQSPPVDAFFLRDSASGGDLGYEVIDFRHEQAMLPYVRPADLQPAESAYLERVRKSMATLNQDLDRATQSPVPPGALTAMRRDFERIAPDLATDTPPRLVLYRDTRVKRFLENYDLILTAEESAAQGQSGQAIHSNAYEQHRRYYYQEPRVAALIGYLYLQEPGRAFTDDELSTVNWAVF